MTIEAINVKLGGAIFHDLYDVTVPNFVEKSIHNSISKLIDTIDIGFH